VNGVANSRMPHLSDWPPCHSAPLVIWMMNSLVTLEFHLFVAILNGSGDLIARLDERFTGCLSCMSKYAYPSSVFDGNISSMPVQSGDDRTGKQLPVSPTLMDLLRPGNRFEYSSDNLSSLSFWNQQKEEA
jgi:hypothetical protein